MGSAKGVTNELRDRKTSRTAVTLVAVQHVQIMSSIRRLAVKSVRHAVRAGMRIDDCAFPDHSRLDLVIPSRGAGRRLNHGPRPTRRAGDNDELARVCARCSDRSDDDFIVVIVRAAIVVDVRVVDKVYDIDECSRSDWRRYGTIADTGALGWSLDARRVHTTLKTRLVGSK
jgi:hypothetical protein